MIHLTNLDLNFNTLQNVVLQNIATQQTTEIQKRAGRLFYYTGDGSNTIQYSKAGVITKLQDAITSVGWVAGTTAGPKPTISAGNSTITGSAIPSASASASGVVTTGAQTFGGVKTFNGINFTAQVSPRTSGDVFLEVVTVNGTNYLHSTLPFYSDSSVTAGGIGSGGGGGTTVDVLTLTQVLAETSEDLTKVPSAYAIKTFHGQFTNGITSLTARVQTLENTTPNVSWGTATDYSVPLSVNGTSKTLLTNGLLSDGKVSTAYLPDFLLGQVMYGGTIAANGVCTLTENFKAKTGLTSLTLSSTTTQAAACEGVYFIATADGTSGAPSTLGVKTGDWVISNGSAWQKIDNTDAVTSVTMTAGTGISVTSSTTTGAAGATIGINSTYQTYISNGNTAFGYFSNGKLPWSGLSGVPNIVNTIGGANGAITLKNGQTGNGSVNLTMSSGQLQASLVLADWAKTANRPTYAYGDSDLTGFGTAATHAHGDYVTSIGTSGNTLTWSKGGTAQTAITVPYATKATQDASGNVITTTYATKNELSTQASTNKSTYTGSKRYTVNATTSTTTFTPTTYDFYDNQIVAALYDSNNNVVVTDMKVVSSNSKYTMQLTFAPLAASATYYLVIIGKLA